MTETAAQPPDDDLLVDELRRVATLADPVPEAWRPMAEQSFGWASIEAVPAQLAYDSRAEAPGGDGRAHAAGTVPREVVYSAGALAIELELDVGADKVRLLGHVVPARSAAVRVLWPEGHAETTCDDSGAFRVDELPRRPLCVHVAADPPVKTGWVIV